MTTRLKISIPAKVAHEYPITIAAHLLHNWPQWLEKYAPSKKVVIISDDTVAGLYGNEFCRQLNVSGYQAVILPFLAGEKSKSITTKLELEEKMFSFGVDRHTLCIALGGGVVGDLAGFTAATYMRGINFIQIPTTLLAMIDSSVGGKTAVNTSYGKNIIGSFWQPHAVVMDTTLLQTLPREQIVNGLFEAVKIFLTCDYEAAIYCRDNLNELIALNESALTRILQRAVTLKAEVVEQDEQELNLRMILNFGHTVGHALEKLSHYQLLHGYGVGIGMLVEAKVANLLGLLSDQDYTLLSDILARMAITPQMLSGYKTSDIISAMRGDKKNINQQIKLVLTTGIGQVKNINNQVAFPVDEAIIIQALTLLQR